MNIQLGYRVPKETKEEFDKKCDELMINKNKLIEKLMQDWIKKNGGE